MQKDYTRDKRTLQSQAKEENKNKRENVNHCVNLHIEYWPYSLIAVDHTPNND